RQCAGACGGAGGEVIHQMYFRERGLVDVDKLMVVNQWQ
ncbi:hypothetical protein AAKU64_003351, partial [Undibacterium sp. GrIS 1.8]